MHRLLLFWAIAGLAFAYQELSPLIECLMTSFNETYQNACNKYVNEIDLYLQVDRDTIADPSLHCTGNDVMMIKFNPGMYIIEQRMHEHNWTSVKATKGSLATFTNLSSSTDYQFRFYEISEDGVSNPQTSDIFSTYKTDYVPLAVKNISLLNLEPDECNLHAEFSFEPAEDRSCRYDVVIWRGEHDLEDFVMENKPEFRFKVGNLMFNRNSSVTIVSVNNRKNDTGRSLDKSKYIVTEPCLTYYPNNLTICAPEMVKGLQATHIYRYGDFYDLNVSWDKPELEPDNYTVQVEVGDEQEYYLRVVPGNTTSVTFSNVKLNPAYVVEIIADSYGGSSYPTGIAKRLDDKHATINIFYRVLIGVAVSIAILILIGTVSFQYYEQRNKRFSTECTRFEGLNPKDTPLENATKLLCKDFENDVNNTSFVHDKFELSPKMLTLDSVIGSGAYGIVRLGSLRDKFGNATDVAIKMLKENPSMDDVQSFHKEILMMQCTGQHQNIVSLIGWCVLYNRMVLVVEYCCKGDLQTYLRTIWQSIMCAAFNQRERLKNHEDPFSNELDSLNRSGGNDGNYQNICEISNRLYDIQQDIGQCTETVTVNDLLNFARQIATGMEFLSSNRIIHRDLAARNVLICEGGIAKISDFGLSRDIYQENLYKKKGNGKLPVKWMAIEALTHQLYTTQSDVWSFGILLWEIVTMGAVPYPGIPTDTILKLLKSGYRMERPLSCGIELYSIMLSCWNSRPQSRPTFTELKESIDKLLSSYADSKYMILSEVSRDQDPARVLMA
ncbi:tyrosine-protein kinase receptor torso-like isoform X2 [Hylaeus volcanicus]|uniref:tyrosine-protein kinase receptor torso-like isoform X2 n=1 Tax=Hylaeus volcanicus TaxID=313075 RepID=UPI0023B80801|nr:tyrosine-protein kinase receptor torso-like isoform X2 [Hylaeus volcanicus]